jgi:hypothetical protein
MPFASIAFETARPLYPSRLAVLSWNGRMGGPLQARSVSRQPVVSRLSGSHFTMDDVTSEKPSGVIFHDPT